MSGDEINMKEWGTFTQVVRSLEEGFKEMRDEWKQLRASIGTRCTDCALGRVVDDIKDRLDKTDDRLRFLEIKVAGIAVISGVVSAFIMHALTKVLR